MNIVIIGAPGAGKGTRAAILHKYLGIPHVATGDLFREHIGAGTKLGHFAEYYISEGELVPDSVAIAMVRERLAKPDCDKGVILDGFPRTVEQARALDEILAEKGSALDLALFIRVSQETLMARLSGRLVCGNCQAVYHVLSRPPHEEGICDLCGGKLYHRGDDEANRVRKRLEVYLAETAPLLEHYRERGMLLEIDGELDVVDIHKQMVGAVLRLVVPHESPRGGDDSSEIS